MKIILLFLAALASFTVHAQPPSQTVEQTVRHIYQNYKSDATAPYFGETGERAITSAYSTGAYPERQSYAAGQYWLAGL